MASPAVAASRVSGSTAALHWAPIPAAKLNGLVRQYHVAQFSSSSVAALRALEIPAGSSAPSAAATDDVVYNGAAGVGNVLEYNATGLVPTLAYAFAVAVENHGDIGPYSGFVVVPAAETEGTGSSSALSTADIVSIVVFVTLPTIIGVFLLLA